MFLLFLICAYFTTLTASWYAPSYSLEHAELHFESFMEQYNRQYINEYEKQLRFQIFKDNLERVTLMNQRILNNIFGITKFMDLTLEEFYNSYTGLVRPINYEQVCKSLTDEDIPDIDAPESLDWRDYNLVTPVMDQKSCNSCYAFSATGNIEGQYAKKYHQLINLSKQQIVDCDERSMGCGGGHMLSAFRSLIDQGGSDIEADYPYIGEDELCYFGESRFKVQVTDCYSINLRSQEKLKQFLYINGPISIAVRAQNLNSYYHSGGIIPDKLCTGDINHGVLLVGYGTENGIPYWIVKNSWGESWGENGYFRMQRGEGADSCGMMNPDMSTAVIA